VLWLKMELFRYRQTQVILEFGNRRVRLQGNQSGIFRAFGCARGKEKETEKIISALSSSKSIHSTSAVTSSHIPPTTTRYTHIFSLVERFTFRPSSTETGMPNLPLKLPLEI
jgi:hypothetical protein